MKTYILNFSVGIMMLSAAACCKPGTGGDATIVAMPKHHDVHIKGAVVYVKYDAKDFPGTNLGSYDTKFTGANNEEHVHCEGLKCGNYYLYAVGYDSAISKVVTGGTAIRINYKERKQELDFDVPVTE